MGVAALQIKVMPSSEADLTKLEEKIRINLEKAGAIRVTIEIQEVAFGLKAMIVTIAWPEQKDTDEAEKAIQEIEEVSSLDVVDYRRAFG
jgi:translation elongation factor aEF-1 beta